MSSVPKYHYQMQETFLRSTSDLMCCITSEMTRNIARQPKVRALECQALACANHYWMHVMTHKSLSISLPRRRVQAWLSRSCWTHSNVDVVLDDCDDGWL